MTQLTTAQPGLEATFSGELIAPGILTTTTLAASTTGCSTSALR